MSSTLTSIGNYLFGWAVITLALSWILAIAYPLFLRVLATGSAQQASRFTLLYALLPPAAAVLALIILSLPALAFPFVAYHCHDAICTPHTLHMTTDTLEGIISVIAVVAILTGLCVLIATQLISSRKRLQAMRDLSEAHPANYRLVDSPDHLAWCAGLLRPQVYLSSGLLTSLSAEQLRIIVAHEQTHAIRRDNLRKWLLYWATLVWPKKIRQGIRQNFSNYSEHICDLVAAQPERGDRSLNTVIETLTAAYSKHSGSMSNGDGHPQEKRIIALERELYLQTLAFESRSVVYVLLGLFTATIWLITIIGAIHFGHPLLEWLSQ
ncbi:MAG: M48 family metalloprotease [Gammaproteobacteria bacterium]|nr:M48 family metalloprotease [Gammaproteobacteria bacterium]